MIIDQRHFAHEIAALKGVDVNVLRTNIGGDRDLPALDDIGATIRWVPLAKESVPPFKLDSR